jgi:8-oxo-dGTP pyrophosphatase MutT (NUDIX family)
MSSSSQRFQRPVGIPSFDPRQVPVYGRDVHLPAVPVQAQTVQAVRQRFARPPAWQPELRGESAFTQRPMAAAAVLLPLVQRQEGLTMLLTQRSEQLSSHSGQIAFPGGRTDPEDPDAVATALREAWEEVGLAPQHAQVLGSLPVYTTGSAYNVTPVVALVPPQPLAPNPQEVAQVFEVPLAFILDPANHQRHRLFWQGREREWFAMPYHDPQGAEHFIWGATAGMLRNFYRFMAA